MMRYLLMLMVVIVLGCKSSKEMNGKDGSGWISLFNGKDLTGWTPKFNGYVFGENYNNTFRVEDGAIVVSYENYTGFKEEYGHLFYKTPYSNYHVKMEYRIFGEQTEGGAGWAYKNSGLMYHCQDPKTMKIDQPFPISLEGQFLGGNGTDERSTMNLCTPGTHVEIGGELKKEHCMVSTSKTYHSSEEWVQVEFIVHGSGDIYHLVAGDTVFHFSNPVYGGDDYDHLPTITEGAPVTGGYLALQAESHPIAFRNIRIREMN